MMHAAGGAHASGSRGDPNTSFYNPDMSNHQTNLGWAGMGGGPMGGGEPAIGGGAAGILPIMPTSSYAPSGVGDVLNTGRGGRAISSSSAGKFCCKCGAGRIDVRFSCCGSGAHARCLFPWPCHSCPSCSKPVSSV